MNVFMLVIFAAVIGGLYWFFAPGSHVSNDRDPRKTQAKAFTQIFMAQHRAAEKYHQQNLVTAGPAQVFSVGTLDDPTYVEPRFVSLTDHGYTITSLKICFSASEISEENCYLGPPSLATLNPSATHYVITYSSVEGLNPQALSEAFKTDFILNNVGLLSSGGQIIPFGGSFGALATISSLLMAGATSLSGVQIFPGNLVYRSSYSYTQMQQLWGI